MRLLLLNPNSSVSASRDMAAIARAELTELGIDGTVTVRTSAQGPSLVATPVHLAAAARELRALAPELTGADADAVIVSAFGDPALDNLDTLLPVPVVGLAGAALAEAAALGPFAIVTSTPDLEPQLVELVRRAGASDAFRGLVYTDGPALALMERPDKLVRSLADACRVAVDRYGVEVIVIGGGPLARAAAASPPPVGVRVIDPVRAAVRAAVAGRRAPC